jgi:putative spermidine/putrescine transport system substrate-binding protein/spermidine/putrescine transport system substrate-binding protein
MKRLVKNVALSAALLAGVALVGSALSASKAEAGELNILTWEGYADPAVTDPYEQRTGCTISRTYVGSNDEFPAKLAGGSTIYDAVSPSIDTTSILAKMGVVEPIDISMIDLWDDIYKSFRAEPGIVGPAGYQMEGQVWAVPFAWGSIAWMYRADSFDVPPTSLQQLWDDPALAGKISVWDDKTRIYSAARLLFGKDVNVYDLSDEQLEEVKESLIELKSKVRKYWATAGELVNLYANGEVWISDTWGGYQSALLQEQGIDMVEFIPIEKADGWQDAWQIVKDTPNMECAKLFVNYMTTPEAQCAMALTMGYSAANPKAVKGCLSPEEYESRHQDDMDYIENLDFWQEPARVDKYIEIWNAVKAAQ